MDEPLNKINGNSLNCDVESPESESMLPPQMSRRLTEVYDSLPITDEIACGVGCCKGSFLQRFANKKMYILMYGIAGAVYGATYSYFNGTLSTMEKRFKIPSRTTGIITVGNDISGMFLSWFITYYTSRGHRPRWISLGLFTVVAFCLLNALPHFLYGPGEDALKLTLEHGDDSNKRNQSYVSLDKKGLCQEEANTSCDDNSGSLAPQIILFVAQLISGVGGALYYTLGIAYMDDNIKKDKTPMLVSISYFIRMLGPAAGYGLSSMCLKMYIAPDLTPTITPKDPRWLGAWWIGWIVLGALLAVFSAIIFLFPKTLPRAEARKILAEEKKVLDTGNQGKKSLNEDNSASFQDMMKTLKRLFSNKILMCNTFSSLFYFFGYTPYWFFMAKYLEIIFKKSASEASFITGNVGIVFSAIGLLSSGFIISKLKPSARVLAGWNVIVGFFTVLGVFSYIFIGCPSNERQMSILANGELQLDLDCNQGCNCEHVKYSPVCTPDGQTYISPCHAGCNGLEKFTNGTKVYTDCNCVDYSKITTLNNFTSEENQPWYVLDRPCAVDCSKQFIIFLIILSSVKFIGATGRLSNFLVAVRCVDEKDKAVAMGFGGTLMSMFAFIPAPITFGFIIDQACIVWGKTCTGTGNCWLYNPESLRLLVNGTAFVFISLGTLFDAGVWYYVKDLKIFDEEPKEEPKKETKKTKQSEKPYFEIN